MQNEDRCVVCAGYVPEGGKSASYAKNKSRALM